MALWAVEEGISRDQKKKKEAIAAPYREEMA